MRSALGIASVTLLLKSLLDNTLAESAAAAGLADVHVSAVAPDRIVTGADERVQLNLFLYRITPNTRWRLPGGAGAAAATDGRGNGARSAPLALDLSYLLTAYGERDFQAELLLGVVVKLLHEVSTLSRDAIRAAVGSATGGGADHTLPPALAGLSADEVADLIAELRISPQFLSMDETSKLWSALQARYRPSLTYQVSVVFVGERLAPVEEAPEPETGQVAAHGVRGRRRLA